MFLFALDFLLRNRNPMHVGAVNFTTSLTLIVLVYSLCLACTFRTGTWFPCSLAVCMFVVFFARHPFLGFCSSLFLVTVGPTHVLDRKILTPSRSLFASIFPLGDADHDRERRAEGARGCAGAAPARRASARLWRPPDATPGECSPCAYNPLSHHMTRAIAQLKIAGSIWV